MKCPCTTVVSVRHARSAETVAQSAQKFDFTTVFESPTRTKRQEARLAQKGPCFAWAPDTHEVLRRSLVDVQNFTFYHSFEHGTRAKFRECSSSPSNYHSFEHRTLRAVKVARRDQEFAFFTTLLNVGHVQSDERVERQCEKFAVGPRKENCVLPQFWDWHVGSDEKVARRSNKGCILPQLWASNMHEVTRGLSNPQVRSLRPGQKK